MMDRFFFFGAKKRDEEKKKKKKKKKSKKRLQVCAEFVDLVPPAGFCFVCLFFSSTVVGGERRDAARR